MSMDREAEVLEMPTCANTNAAHTRRIAQGRAAVERYVERLESATERLKTGPEASELFCALAELREGIIENDPVQVQAFYQKALDTFKLSHGANRGLRRLARTQQKFDDSIAFIERELSTSPNQKSLQLELVRTWLYCAKEAEKAISILESLDNVDSDASTFVPEAGSFDPETFLLWEDALLATGAWDRYEAKLKSALASLKDTGAMTQHVEERLWLLYRYIMPDDEQARILCKHLMSFQPLDDELVEDELSRSLKSSNKDAAVSILNLAIERLEGSQRADFYRSLLVDIAQFQFDDRDHAMELLSTKNDASIILLHQYIGLLNDCGRLDLLLESLARSLEFIQTPQKKAEQLYFIACILRDDIESEDASIDIFKEANTLCPTHEPTIEALAKYYSKSHDWENLAQLYEYEISYATEHQLPEYTPEVFLNLHSRLAYLYENKLHVAFNAFNHYQAMLKYRADDIAALKGASRMAQSVGNWPELLQLYADAEGCTQDPQEHIYLLQRIAQIADVYLNDADTACTAMEALKDINSKNVDTTTPTLARLYIKLKKWDELIRLTDEEIENVSNPEYKASLLCRNAEIAELQFANLQQAVQYYEKARSVYPPSNAASNALERLYEQLKNWDKLTDLIKARISQTSDVRIKCALYRRLADIYIFELDSDEDAINVYENILKLNPKDAVARQSLLTYYSNHENWDEVIRLLYVELNADGTLGYQWLTHFWIGRIELYHKNDEQKAFNAFTAAFELNPNDLIIFHTWLAVGKCLGKSQDIIDLLEKILPNVTNEIAHDEIELAIADLKLKISHDPNSVLDLLSPYESSSKFQGRGARFLSTMLVAANSANGHWISRLALALNPRQPKDIQRHALLAAVVLNFPDEIEERAKEVLAQLPDMELARTLWAYLPPAKRPDFNKLPLDILQHPSREAQDLRRWCTISRFLSGQTTDPTDYLLPDDRDDSLSYRPDLELLAAYFERFEQWEKLLEVLNVQEKSLNQQEIIIITLQKAWVLTKIKRPEDALLAIRQACEQCPFDNPMRDSLYDYLSNDNDWDFLQEQIRQHLMHSDDNIEKSALWMRLANINLDGLNNLNEALRCMDHAYHENPDRGDILRTISDTAQKIGELDIARLALHDYMLYHKPSLEIQLELEPKLLDLHFNHPGGDTENMLKYFDDLATKTGRSRDCLVILAKAHAIAGDPQIAAEAILQLVSVPIAENDLELWITLGDLYLDKLNEQKQGEKLLWELFKTFPHIEYVFIRLEKLYKTPTERRIFVENIKRYVKESKAIMAQPALVRKFLHKAATILSNELHAYREAQELYTDAINASAEPSHDLAKDRAYARSRIQGEAKQAFTEFCELLVQNPFQPDIYQAALDICKRNDANDRAKILRQLASIFVPEAKIGSDIPELRPKLMGSRLISDDILLEHLTHPSLRPVQLILHEAMPILSNCLRDLIPKRTNLGSEKIKNQNILDLFNTCSEAFGIENPKAFYGHDATPVPTVLDEPDSFWISAESWENMKPDVQRHWAGYAAGMLWTGVSKITWSEPREIWQLLDGIYYLATNKSIMSVNAYTKEAADKITSYISFPTFQKGLRRDIARLIDEVGTENLPVSKASGWMDGLYATADRAGLLFSGSLTASIPAILEAEGWSPDKTSSEYLAARFKQSKRIPELIRFALSDDYLNLRFRAGLSMQPSSISG